MVNWWILNNYNINTTNNTINYNRNNIIIDNGKNIIRKDLIDKNGFVIQYSLPLINSIIVYLSSIGNENCLNMIYLLALKLDCKGRYHLFSGVCNNLRYPNSPTKFCSQAILFMFKKSNVIEYLTDELIIVIIKNNTF